MVYGLNYVNVPGMSESGCTFLDPLIDVALIFHYTDI